MANADLDISNKIIQFLDGEEWKKYPTYEHALEDLIEKIVSDVQEKQTAELKAQNEQLKSILSKCYNKCFSNNLRTCDDDLLELKGQIKKLLKE